MTHTGGLSEVDARYADLGPAQTVHDYLVSVFARADDRGADGQYLRWNGKVGERASYSNIGITLLGYLVEITNPDHLSYAEYVRKHIQQPLGMKSTFFPPDHDEPAQPNGLSTGYAAIGGVLLPAPRLWVPVHPAGTLYATAAEHLRLVLAFLNGGSYGGQSILSRTSAEQMLTPTVPILSGHVGLVWMLDHQGQPNAYFGHGGAYMFGWTNTGVGFPRYDVGVVVTVNRWPMQTYGQARAENLIVEFIGNWLALEEAGPRTDRPARSWAWKRSYAIGMIMGYSYHGALQARTRLTPKQLHTMGAGAIVQSGAPAKAEWDAAGYVAGFEDIAPIASDPEAVKAFLKSPKVKVHPAELDLLFADVGGRGGLPAP
ncbi:MAG: serine hydrolase domain-containing protein, partial [Gemmatimonadota bacterium]